MQDAGINVTVYFVIRGSTCDLATSEQAKAMQFVETFNRLRLASMPIAEIRERTLTL